MVSKPYTNQPVPKDLRSMLSCNIHEALAVVKGLTNARPVVNRLLRGDEPGALAEVETAYLISRAGYRVEFSSHKAPAPNPDLVAWIGGHKVNVETMFLQPPTGGRMRLTEVDRIKRAIDNKSRQLPRTEPGIIVLYNQAVAIRDLQGAGRQIQERLFRYPYIRALIVIKDLPRILPERQKETDNFLMTSKRINHSARYIFLVKGIDLQPHLLDSLKEIFMPPRGQPQRSEISSGG